MSPYAIDSLYFDARSASYHHIPSIPSTKKRLAPTQQRSVTFAINSEVFEIEHINDLRQVIDVNTVWLSEEDYECIKSDITNTVRDMEAGNVLNEDDQCARGLEGLTCNGRKVKQEHKLRGSFSVLEEQALQRHEGINDPELLADVFFDTTFRCQSHAEWIGIQDMNAILS